MPRDLAPDTVVDLLRQSAEAPFEEARAMPPEVYTSEAFLSLEQERIFARDWYCVGRTEALASPGDYLTCDLAGQPIMVLRDADGDLRAQSNVCLHRMSTLLQGRGTARAIVCPYHAWTYALDGALKSAPAMSKNTGFCKKAYTLPQVRCEEWLGFAFVTLNPDAPPVAKTLADAAEMIAAFDLTNYTESFFEEHVWDTNWKVLAENFMESYHLPVCHAQTVGALSRLDEMVCPPGKPGFNWHTILKDGTLRIANAHPSNTRLKGDERRVTVLLALYPSLLITVTPGYFWYLSLLPLSPGKVHIRFGGGMCDDYKDDADAQQNFVELKMLLDQVNEEDRGCTEKVYRGLCSAMAAPGHLSHLERPNYDFARYLLERVSG